MAEDLTLKAQCPPISPKIQFFEPGYNKAAPRNYKTTVTFATSGASPQPLVIQLSNSSSQSKNAASASQVEENLNKTEQAKNAETFHAPEHDLERDMDSQQHETEKQSDETTSGKKAQVNPLETEKSDILQASVKESIHEDTIMPTEIQTQASGLNLPNYLQDELSDVEQVSTNISQNNTTSNLEDLNNASSEKLNLKNSDGRTTKELDNTKIPESFAKEEPDIKDLNSFVEKKLTEDNCTTETEIESQGEKTSLVQNESENEAADKDKKEGNSQTEQINSVFEKEENKVVIEDQDKNSNVTQPKAPMFDIIKRDYRALFGAKETQTKETVSSARDNEDKSQTVVEDKKEDDKPQSEHINFDLDKEEEKVVEKDNEIKSNATQTQPKAPMFDVIRRDYKTLFGEFGSQTEKTLDSVHSNEDENQTVGEGKKEDGNSQTEQINPGRDEEENEILEDENEKSNATQAQPKASMFDVIRKDYRSLFGGSFQSVHDSEATTIQAEKEKITDEQRSFVGAEDTVNETSQSVNEETMLLDHKSDEEKMTKSKISFFEGVKTWFGDSKKQQNRDNSSSTESGQQVRFPDEVSSTNTAAEQETTVTVKNSSQNATGSKADCETSSHKRPNSRGRILFLNAIKSDHKTWLRAKSNGFALNKKENEIKSEGTAEKIIRAEATESHSANVEATESHSANVEATESHSANVEATESHSASVEAANQPLLVDADAPQKTSTTEQKPVKDKAQASAQPDSTVDQALQVIEDVKQPLMETEETQTSVQSARGKLSIFDVVKSDYKSLFGRNDK